MTIHTVTLDEKMAKLGRIIAADRKAGNNTDVLSAIYADLEARETLAPSAALTKLDQRMVVVKRSKTALGYGNGQMVALAQEVVSGWTIIRQALERFGAEIEQEVSGE